MATVEIRLGQGGLDAKLFGADVADTIATWARRQGMTATVGRAGTVLLPHTPARQLAWWSGVHRKQSVPATRLRGAGNKQRHTSYVTVVVLDDDQEQGTETPLRTDPKIRVKTSRGHGPGGQHRNMTDSCVTVRHVDYPDIRPVTVNSGRSQTANLTAALAELAARMVTADRTAAADARQRARQDISEEVAFTWSDFLGTVKHHASGQTCPLRTFRQGRFTAPPRAAAS